ncbi:MAG: 16S rRNA (uracil(1498)-N(3))-methyltransferase [Coriobacteriia bacterium]|nr:16S rRNA (uracil(1498)-N(3))-methyltransferase [Coriobacteriia bacterium]
MSLHRFFLTEALAAGEGARVRLPLDSEDCHHAVSVLRLRVGEKIEGVEPDGGVWCARVEAADRDALVATLLTYTTPVARRRPQVTLVQGVAKGEKMDAIVRQAVEVGADAVLPVLTERSIVRLDERKRAERGERWQRIAKSAAEQAHRTRVPQVAHPADWREAREQLAGADAVVVLWEDEHATSLAEALAPLRGRTDAHVALVVGPEGGLSPDEVAVLREAGATVATLGEPILRTETAAVVAVALAIHELERA